MKRLTLLFLFVAYLQPVYSNEIQKDSKTISATDEDLRVSDIELQKRYDIAVNGLKIGYFVYVQKCGEVAELKTTDLDEAQVFIRSFYPYFCEDLEYEFEYTPYYRVLAFEKEIYCEQMRITKSGKYKRIKNFTK